MTASIREQLLRAVVAMLEPVVVAEGSRLIRSPTVGVNRESAPALLLIPESDQISDRPNDRVERQLVNRLVAISRETDSEPAESCADRMLVAEHRALFANSSLCASVNYFRCCVRCNRSRRREHPSPSGCA